MYIFWNCTFFVAEFHRNRHTPRQRLCETVGVLFEDIYYMENYSVSLAAYEFTINGTEKCITAYASLYLLELCGLPPETRLEMKLCALYRGLRNPSVFIRMKTKPKTKPATRRNPKRLRKMSEFFVVGFVWEASSNENETHYETLTCYTCYAEFRYRVSVQCKDTNGFQFHSTQLYPKADRTCAESRRTMVGQAH